MRDEGGRARRCSAPPMPAPPPRPRPLTPYFCALVRRGAAYPLPSSLPKSRAPKQPPDRVRLRPFHRFFQGVGAARHQHLVGVLERGGLHGGLIRAPLLPRRPLDPPAPLPPQPPGQLLGQGLAGAVRVGGDDDADGHVEHAPRRPQVGELDVLLRVREGALLDVPGGTVRDGHYVGEAWERREREKGRREGGEKKTGRGERGACGGVGRARRARPGEQRGPPCARPRPPNDPPLARIRLRGP